MCWVMLLIHENQLLHRGPKTVDNYAFAFRPWLHCTKIQLLLSYSKNLLKQTFWHGGLFFLNYVCVALRKSVVAALSSHEFCYICWAWQKQSDVGVYHHIVEKNVLLIPKPCFPHIKRTIHHGTYTGPMTVSALRCSCFYWLSNINLAGSWLWVKGLRHCKKACSKIENDRSLGWIIHQKYMRRKKTGRAFLYFHLIIGHLQFLSALVLIPIK